MISTQSEVHEEKSEDTLDYNRSRGKARQDSKTKRRKQQKQNISDKGFKARNVNSTKDNL